MRVLRSPWFVTALVVLCVVLYLGWTSGTRVFIDDDEGIYLDGGLRILHGELPYRDFFALTGPGTYFEEALSFRLFGVTLAAGRIPVIFDLGLMAGCVLWLTWKLSGRLAAILTASAFVALETLGQGVLANHRWDSSAWMTLSATLIFGALDTANSKRVMVAALAGFAATLAVLCTPPVALAGAAIGICLLFSRTSRQLLPAYIGGIVLASVSSTALLAASGVLGPMIRSTLWTMSNYSGANHTPYGWVIGGYANLFRGISPGQTIVTGLVVFFITLPATLPFFCSAWLWMHPRIEVVVLLATAVTLVLSTYPRWDLMHLKWVGALFYVLTAAIVVKFRFRNIVAMVAFTAAFAFLAASAMQRWSEESRQTQIGKVHGPHADLEEMAMLQNKVQSSDTLFVFPYRPIEYFLTLAHNPTRYSFLQPGMFPDSDARLALDELQKQPPRWVVYINVPEAALLRIWPQSDPARLHMPEIESFLASEYSKIDERAGVQLLERRGHPPLAYKIDLR